MTLLPLSSNSPCKTGTNSSSTQKSLPEWVKSTVDQICHRISDYLKQYRTNNLDRQDTQKTVALEIAREIIKLQEEGAEISEDLRITIAETTIDGHKELRNKSKKNKKLVIRKMLTLIGTSQFRNQIRQDMQSDTKKIVDTNIDKRRLSNSLTIQHCSEKKVESDDETKEVQETTSPKLVDSNLQVEEHQRVQVKQPVQQPRRVDCLEQCMTLANDIVRSRQEQVRQGSTKDLDVFLKEWETLLRLGNFLNNTQETVDRILEIVTIKLDQYKYIKIYEKIEIEFLREYLISSRKEEECADVKGKEGFRRRAQWAHQNYLAMRKVRLDLIDQL